MANSVAADKKQVFRRTVESFDSRSSVSRTTIFLVSLLLIYTVWSAWLDATQTPTIDFFTFWSVPQILDKHPVQNIYAAEGQRQLAAVSADLVRSPFSSELQRQTTAAVLQLYEGRLDTTASPALYALVGTFSSGNYIIDQRIFLFSSMTALILAVLILGRLLDFSALEIVLFLLFLFANHEPWLSDIRVGNVNAMQLFALAVFIWFLCRSRPLSAGLVIGASMAFKPTALPVLAVAVIAFVADRDYRSLLRMSIGAIVSSLSLVVLSAIYFGDSSMWFEFFHSLRKTLDGTRYALESGNYSLAALVFGSASGRSTILLITLICACGFILYSSRRQRQNPPSSAPDFRLQTAFCIAGCGSAIMLLSSPLVWLQYYLLLLPLSLYLCSRRFTQGPRFSGNPPFWSSVLVLSPYLLLFCFSLLFHMFLGARLRLMCAFIIAATLLTTVLAAHSIWQQRRMLSAGGVLGDEAETS